MLRPARFEMKNNSRFNRGGFNAPNLVWGIHHAKRESRLYGECYIISWGHVSGRLRKLLSKMVVRNSSLAPAAFPRVDRVDSNAHARP